MEVFKNIRKKKMNSKNIFKKYDNQNFQNLEIN